MFDLLKIKMSEIPILKKVQPKNTNFAFLKGRYFIMGGPIVMNVGVFLKDLCGFSKKCDFVTFPKIQPKLI